MPQGERSGGISANVAALAGCDVALPVTVRGVRGAVPGAFDAPSRPRRPATAARTRMSSVRTGRRAGAPMPPRAIALITPQGYRSLRGPRHEPHVYKTTTRTWTFCTAAARRAGRHGHRGRGRGGRRVHRQWWPPWLRAVAANRGRRDRGQGSGCDRGRRDRGQWWSPWPRAVAATLAAGIRAAAVAAGAAGTARTARTARGSRNPGPPGPPGAVVTRDRQDHQGQS